MRATGLGGTCTTLDSRRARATEMDFEPIDFPVVDQGAAHRRQDQLSPHTRDRTKLTEGNLRLLAAGSPPSAPPPRPAALALRLFSMTLDRNNVDRYRIRLRMTALGDQWLIGREPAGT